MSLNHQSPDIYSKEPGKQANKRREELIVRHVPLVHFVLVRLGLSQAMGADYEDAYSQGLVGLIEAADRYTLAYGCQFSTYATLRIRGKVLDYLREQDWLSRGARKRVNQTQKAVFEFWTKHQRAPSEQELASYLNLKPRKLRQSLEYGSRTMVSLDAAIDRHGIESDYLQERLVDVNQVEPSKAVEEREQKQTLERALSTLTKQERRILALYYSRNLTLTEIGNRMGFSESRASQLHRQAVKKLRVVMDDHGFGLQPQ